MWTRTKSVVFFIFFLSACTRHLGTETPEGAIKEYVRIGFNAQKIEDRSKLLELSTGEAYDDLAKISDSEFTSSFIQSKLRLLNLQIHDLRKETNGDVSLIYEISYEEPGTSGHTILTNKKIAFLTQDTTSKLWKIKATTNVKSLIERKEDLQVTSRPNSK